MNERAEPSGISLNSADAAIVKGMLNRGDRQHDIAAWFGVNGGRVADIKTGKTFAEVKPAIANNLPAPGPYLAGKDAHAALKALESVAQTTHAALQLVRELKDADTAIYALEETEKSVNDAIAILRERMRMLAEGNA
ncbi:MAG TPA: hypothetical protein VFA65_19535 [Bryobacteraceae bacterium]|nr:hypothetical protein [Bryobacteraceae bacterium]